MPAFKKLFPALFLLITVFLSSCTGEVKEPSVAGAFYPADAGELKAMVEGFLKNAENKPIDGDLLAVISPHAGYVFSGQVAAYGYKHLAGKRIDTVVIIGVGHQTAFKGASVYAKGSFKTPLGTVKINEKIAGSLIDEKSDVTFNRSVYDKEHSIEVQIPFLQVALKNKFSIVPVLIGAPTRESFDHLVRKLAEAVSNNKNVLIVASTDLSHYHDYDTARAMDEKIVNTILRLSARGCEKLLATGESEMCGAYPVMVTLETVRMLGANMGELFKYANSGDVTSDKQRVVGYASIGLYRSALSKAEKDALLNLAKDTVREYVKTGKTTEPDIKDPKLLADGAVFVTINRKGSLRGCIGHIHPVMSLYQSVQKNAVAASSMDPRFPPMTPEELNDMDIEISVLSPLVPVKDTGEIEVGKHGLYIMKDGKGGILLPQVPVAYGWDRETFLKEVSEKAGLPPDAWKSNATLLKFTAEIIK